MGLLWWRWTNVPQTPVASGPRFVDLAGATVTVERTLDCMGAACPRPQLLTMKVLDQLQEGQVIEVLSDNPATVETLPALMFVVCGTHLGTVKEADHWRVYLQKGLATD
ncbi:MAG: sulfurtransferase TusA family protein [Gammaproteobacteria bacterium]|nr:sulfurtransferase TusA family protein [Gammaproteobacteria bacterium]